MSTPQFISVPELMQHLKDNDLVIVSKKQLLDNETLKVELLRKDLLKKKWMSLQEVVAGKFLPITTKSGVRSWIDSGKIKADAVNHDSRGRIMVLTSEIKRLFDHEAA